jgi:hypothetical protein
MNFFLANDRVWRKFDKSSLGREKVNNGCIMVRQLTVAAAGAAAMNNFGKFDKRANMASQMRHQKLSDHGLFLREQCTNWTIIIRTTVCLACLF